MPLVVTGAPLLASYSVTEFMLHLRGGLDLGPSGGDATCCELGHQVALNGSVHDIPCDRERIAQSLVKLLHAKLETYMANQDYRALSLAGVAPMLLSTTAQGRAEVRAAMRQRLDAEWGKVAPWALLMAIHLQDEDAVQELLASHAHPRSPETVFEVGARHAPTQQVIQASPLHLCATVGNLKIADMLMVGNVVGIADIESVGPLFCTAPLHHAAGCGHAKFVEWLLKKAACVNVTKLPPNTYTGQTPLHCAAIQGHAECCEILLQHRADLGSCDAAGATPLHAAVLQPVHFAGSHEPDAIVRVIHLLLAARGDPTVKDSAGRTPIDLATAWGLGAPTAGRG